MDAVPKQLATGKARATTGRSTSPASEEDQEHVGASGSGVSMAGQGFRQEIVEEAEGIVARFRQGKIPKADAIGQLFTALDVDGEGADHDARAAAYQSYCGDIEKESELEKEAAERGKRMGEAGGSGADGNDTSAKAVSALEAHLASLERISLRRRREDDDDGSEGSDIGGSKRPRLDRDQLPWSKRDEELTVATSNPNGAETRRLLLLFSANPTNVVQDIRIRATAPDFPVTEWNSIIRGNAVDLDKVFSSLHHVHPPKENIGRLGDREITFGAPRPAKTVETQADWHAAWVATCAAYDYAFAHRRSELEEYGRYILQLFAAKVPSAAGRVILNREAYSHLREAILSVDGVEAHGFGGSRGRGGREGFRTGTCDKFNRASGCGSNDGSCRYRHECKSCGGDDHGQSSCKRGRGEKA